MSGLGEQKRLLLQQIDGRRTRLRTELTALRGSVRPLTRLIGWGSRLAPLWTVARPAARSLGRVSGPAGGRWWRFLPWLLLLLPLLGRRESDDDTPVPADDE